MIFVRAALGSPFVFGWRIGRNDINCANIPNIISSAFTQNPNRTGDMAFMKSFKNSMIKRDVCGVNYGNQNPGSW